MARKKGSTYSHTSMAPPENNNAMMRDDFTPKMDAILKVIQGYEGKVDTTAKLVLEIQRKFDERLEAMEHKNNLFKAQFKKSNDSKKEESSTRNEIDESKHQDESITKSQENLLKNKKKEEKKVEYFDATSS